MEFGVSQKKTRIRSLSVAAIDLFVVVVGVFIGIQASNWNDARLDQLRARSYHERIRADLDADIANYRVRLAFWEHVLEYGARGLGYAETGNLGNFTEWDLLLAYFQASQLDEFYTTQTTYDELKSGGELGLIGDLELRNSLAYYYTNANNPTLTERPAYREHVRGLIPLHVQVYIWENCYSSNDLGIQVMHECETPVDPGEAAQLLAAISGDKQLISELRFWMSTMRVALLIGGDRVAFATKIRDSIDAKTGGVPGSGNP